MKRKRMKRFNESRLGLGHIAEVLRTAKDAGVQAIVNDADGLFFLYDPTKKEWVILDNAYLSRIDATIFDVIEDRSTFGQVWWDCRATEFEDFKVEWNKLFSASAQGDEDVFASSNCEPIEDDEFVDDFGDRVNGIEARVSESRDFDEDMDDPNDWSASEGEVEIIWDTDEYEDFGIFSGDTSHYVIDYDRVDTHDGLINEVCRLIGKEYPDLDFDPSDFIIANEEEFWEQRGENPGKWDDDDDLYLESSNEEEFTVKWIIDDEVLGIEIGDTETVVVDLDYVDSFEELVRQATMELKRNHQGMLFVYDVDWLFPNEEELLKRFGDDALYLESGD